MVTICLLEERNCSVIAIVIVKIVIRNRSVEILCGPPPSWPNHQRHSEREIALEVSYSRLQSVEPFYKEI